MPKTENAGIAITTGRTLDHAAKFYDLLNPLVTFGQESRFSERAIELLELSGGEKVLDVGCGTGTLTINIAKKLRQKKELSVIGLDAAPKMLEVARRKSAALQNIRFDFGAAEELPYEDNFFDCVVSTFFFHHVNYALKKRCLDEMRRVVKKRGKVVITDVDRPTNLFGRLCAYAGYRLFEQDEILENIKGKLEEAIGKCGFKEKALMSHHLGYISIFKLIK